VKGTNTVNIRRLKRPLVLVTTLVGSILAGATSADELASTEQLVAEMNQRITTIMRSSPTDEVIPRFNQAKSLGCLDATFRVHESVNNEFRQGLFAQPGSYRARLRFANASQQDDSKKDIRGLSIKIFGVRGETLWGESGIQDFLLNSYPALFVGTPEDFLDFIRARQEDKMAGFFINPFDSHLKSLWILFKARAVHSSPFNIRYWSTTPYRLGTDDSTVVKYSVTPCSGTSEPPARQPGKDQLRSAMKAHLSQAPACLEFGIQKRTHPDDMPIEDASVIWDEDASPFHTVATISIHPQAFDTPEALAACEKISFNPWQSLSEHQPLGRMNAVRRETYLSASQLRTKEAP